MLCAHKNPGVRGQQCPDDKPDESPGLNRRPVHRSWRQRGNIWVTADPRAQRREWQPRTRSQEPITQRRDALSERCERGNAATTVQGAHPIQGAHLGGRKRPPARGRAFAGTMRVLRQPSSRARNGTGQAVQPVPPARFLSLFEKPFLIFLKLTSSVEPFNFILTLGLGQTQRLGLTAAVPFAGSSRTTSEAAGRARTPPDCQSRIYILQRPCILSNCVSCIITAGLQCSPSEPR